MRILLSSTCAVFVLSLILTSCQTAPPVSNLGAGYESLTPSRATRVFIANNDRPFAEQVINHNKTCAKHAACKKNPTIKE